MDKKDAAVVEEADEKSPILGKGKDFLNSRAFGLILITTSAISYGLSASLVSLESDIATPLLLAVRFMGTFGFNAIACVIMGVDLSVEKGNRQLVLIRSVCGFASFVCGTYAFQNMPVGEATVIISMAPVFVAIFSMCLLGVRARPCQIVMIILSLVGVVLIMDPTTWDTSESLSIVAVFTAVGQAFFKSLSYISIKKSNNRVYFMTMIFWYSLSAVSACILFIGILYPILSATGSSTAWLWTNCTTSQILILITISFLGFLAQLTLTKAAQLINTTTISLIRNSDILVTMIFQICFESIWPDWMQWIGMVLMIVCTVTILLTKEEPGKEEEEK